MFSPFSLIILTYYRIYVDFIVLQLYESIHGWWWWWWWLLLYSAGLRSQADSRRSHVILHEWLAYFIECFFNIHRSGVLTALAWLVRKQYPWSHDIMGSGDGSVVKLFEHQTHDQKEWVNNCWWGWQNKTDLGRCTHLYKEIQGTVKHKRLRQKVFIRCEIDQ